MGEELTHVDDIEVSNLPIESIDVGLPRLQSTPAPDQPRGSGKTRLPKQDSLGQAVDKLVMGGILTQNEKAGVGEIHTPP